jgi:hypothetical protein
MGQRLGTPISGNLINCTGYKFTSIGTFSSADLRSALTDETGTGAAVFATSPTLVTPALGTPASGNLVNCTGGTLTNSVLNASPSNPTGTASGTPVMMGLGGTCVFTPSVSARVKFGIYGTYANSTGANTGVRFYRGTGTAPANGVATTGTQIGPTWSLSEPVATGVFPFAMEIISTGLTPATAYWFDIALNAGGGTSTIGNLNFTAMEI